MEHPIPQNVTSFQFRLIGDMTLKQFMYLSIGVGIAYLNFVFVISVLPLVAWPVIVISSSLGAAFAFLPIADRPLDYWLSAFLKAIYSPTKRVWVKNNLIFTNSPIFPQRMGAYAHIMPEPVIRKVNIPGAFKPVAAPTPTPQADTPLPPKEELPTKDELSKTVELAQQAQTIQKQIIDSQKQLDVIKNAGAQNPEQYSQINSILTTLHNLISEASKIKGQLATVTHTEPAKQATPVEVLTSKPKQTQIVLTSSPNVINGIVLDSAGSYLDAAVVVIYDKDGLPVRALKTNKLGQFSGATPLPNGKYTLQMEKENLVFDVLQITLDGKVLPPLPISAKKLV